MVAVILGTGTNACYVERVDSIPKRHGQKSTTGNTVCEYSNWLMTVLYDKLRADENYLFQIVNTEWGAFSNGLPLTEFDREMDADSINPGEQVSANIYAGRDYHSSGVHVTKYNIFIYIVMGTDF